MTTTAAATRASSGNSTIDCAPYEAFGDLKGKTVTVYTSITAPEDAPHIASYKPFVDCTGVDDQVRRLQGVRGPAAGARQGWQRPRHRLPAAARSARDPGRTTGAVKEAPAGGRRQRRQEHARLEELRHRRRQVLRRPARRQREVLRLVLPDRRSRTRATRCRRRGPSCSRCPTRSSPTTPTARSSRGAPASSPVTPPAGRPPTGSRTSCSARRAPRPTTSGSSHEIPFNDPAVATALAEVGKILKNDKYVNGGYGDVKTIASTSFQDAGQPILDGDVLHAPPGVVLRGQLARGHQGRPRRRRVGLLPAVRRRPRPSRCSAAASSRRPSPTVPRSRPSRPTSPRSSGPTSAPRPAARGGCVTANKNADPATC